MFTGIITDRGAVHKRVDVESSVQLYLHHTYSDVVRGESIAINGVCLTAIPEASDCIRCDVSSETLQCSNLGALQPGDAVNLERALCLSDRLGGHFVSGHVDQPGQVMALVNHDDKFTAMTIGQVRPENRAYLSPKGSVAVNGVSLTVNDGIDDSFNVMLIPETLQQTTLSKLQVGDKVNLEFDLLAKMVARQLVGAVAMKETD